MWEPWNVRSRDLLIKLAVLLAGGPYSLVRCSLVICNGIWLIQHRAIDALLLQKFRVLLVVHVVRNSHHAVEAGLPHRLGDEGLLRRREHGHISHDLIEEGTATINEHAVLRHVLGRLALVNIEGWLHALRICKAPLPLPVAVLLHLGHVVAKVHHFTVHLVLAQHLFQLGNTRFRSTSQDPQDVAARLHERCDRLDEAFEVRLVKQRLAVRKAWKELGRTTLWNQCLA